MAGERSKWTRFWLGELYPDESRQAADNPPSQVGAESESQGSGFDRSHHMAGSPGPLDKPTIWTLVIFGVGYLAWAFSQILYLGIIGGLEDLSFAGSFTTYPATEFQAVLDSIAMVALVEIFASVVMAGAVIYFFFSSYRNIERFGAKDLRYSASQTIWTWFVPILNLFRPKQIANDIWRASTSLDPATPGAWREAPVTFAMGAWWTFWIIGGVISWRLFVVELGRDSTTPGWEISLIYAGFFVFILHSVAAALLVYFMIRVKDAQAVLLQSVYQGPPEGYVEVPSPEEEA